MKTKVYIVMAFDAEPHSHGSWVHGVYDSEEKSLAVIGNDLYRVHDADVDGYGGYMLSNHIYEEYVQ